LVTFKSFVTLCTSWIGGTGPARCGKKKLKGRKTNGKKKKRGTDPKPTSKKAFEERSCEREIEIDRERERWSAR
jgi:hypothetical protein